MIVVTGGSGFIGSAVVRALCAEGHEVTVVDDVAPDGRLDGVAFDEYVTPSVFAAGLAGSRGLEGVSAVVHQGACSSTLVTDEDYLRRVNDGYSEVLLHACRSASVPLIYASSAGVYGGSTTCSEEPRWESPLTPYAWSKLRFDRVVRSELSRRDGSQVVGLRYFNVYGPGEGHKGPMASVVLQLWKQLEATGEARIFGAGEGCGPGMHRRDFIHVDDVVAVVRHFLGNGEVSGIFNCGTGVARTFRDLGDVVVTHFGSGELSFIPFPEHLVGRYQATTQADLSRLVASGCAAPSISLEDGVARYVEVLNAGHDPRATT